MLSMRTALLWVACLGIGLGLGAAAPAGQGEKVITVPGPAVSASEGALMYVQYCAQCHGATGRGDGVLAKAFKVAPTDLTLLSATHSPGFPREHVLGTLVAGHATGPRESRMPDWSVVFQDMDRTNGSSLLRAGNLVDYVESLQATPLPSTARDDI